ncbi:hypothetical protein E4V51_04760 [Paenibacillus sp. 28ISP30-2]|nr:hypothetical protein [Paenibacillus sp. 28ISP30-2]
MISFFFPAESRKTGSQTGLEFKRVPCRSGALSGGFFYATKLFKEAMIRTLTEDYLRVLSQIAENPQLELSRIECHKPAAGAKSAVDTIEFAF